MSNPNNSSAMVHMAVVRFIDAFCRRNLSASEIKYISDLFDCIAEGEFEVNSSDSFYESLERYLRDTSHSVSQIVTNAPNESTFGEQAKEVKRLRKKTQR